MRFYQLLVMMGVLACGPLLLRGQAGDSLNVYQSIRLPRQAHCKLVDSVAFIIDQSLPFVDLAYPTPAFASVNYHTATVHGNVSYWFNYRSRLDSPFTQTGGLHQHILQTSFRLHLFRWLPLTAIVTSRRSNSPFFSDRTDVSFQYRKPDPQTLMASLMAPYTRLEQQLGQLSPDRLPTQWPSLDKAMQQLPDNDLSALIVKKIRPTLDSLQRLAAQYKSRAEEAQALLRKLNAAKAPNLQLLAAEAERKWLKLDSAKGAVRDSLQQRVGRRGNGLTEKAAPAAQKMEQLAGRADSCRRQADSLRQVYQKRFAVLSDTVRRLYARLHQAIRSPGELPAAGRLHDSVDRAIDQMKSRYPLLSLLSSVQKFSIGRAQYDYSELTVKNVIVNGAELEMQAAGSRNRGRQWYLAGGGGVIDYGFRDFLYAGSRQPRQHLQFLRLGYGLKAGTHIYFTYYQGRKAIYNQLGQADPQTVLPVAGTSVELSWRLLKAHRLTAEYARSTLLYRPEKNIPFNHRDNSGWFVQYQGDFPGYHSYVNASLRHTGALFQSFNLFTPGTRQTAVQLTTRHQLFNKRLTLTTGLRTNEYVNPFTQVPIATNSLLATLQATWIKQGWPTVSVGVTPTTMSTLMDGQQLFVHQFNSVNAMMSHQLPLAGGRLTGTLNYNKLVNRGADSGFRYYNASIVTAYGQWARRKWSVDGTLTRIAQSYLPQTDGQLGLQYKVADWLSLYGALKSVLPQGQGLLWANSQRLTIRLKKLGELQLLHERLWLPTFQRSVLSTDIGTVYYTKTF